MILRESQENYLETIYVLTMQKEVLVRNVRMAEALRVSKASATVMLRQLSEDGYVTRNRDGIYTLTETGEEIGRKVYDRHCYFFLLLQKSGVEKATAEAEACRMEHILCDESFEKIKRFLNAAGVMAGSAAGR